MPFPPVLPDEYKHTGIAPFGSPGVSFTKKWFLWVMSLIIK